MHLQGVRQLFWISELPSNKNRNDRVLPQGHHDGDLLNQHRTAMWIHNTCMRIQIWFQLLKIGFANLKHLSKILYSRVEWFWNWHLAHLKMDSNWKSKTKIVKAFFIILSSFRSRLVFVEKIGQTQLNNVQNYFLKI